MTMLDRMRRHKSWLKWSLGLVCLAFIIAFATWIIRAVRRRFARPSPASA